MKVGYAFWGFLGDKKYNENYEEISTPDGNAFYSWSIIKAFLDKGDYVKLLMTDRDKYGYELSGDSIFCSWCKDERSVAYDCSKDIPVSVNMILLEWRWLIEGRNNIELRESENWQPDLFQRNEIIKYAKDDNIPLVVFDLDYKLTEEDIKEFGIKYVIELGDKWKDSKLVKSKKVFIPFDFNCINYFEVKDECKTNLVYVGNRYERDWCIDKYIPEDLDDCIVYGNWKEGGRDSESRWNKITFGKRLQTSEMYDVYSNSIATILLAKEEYCKMHFMTARITEAIFYGCVPLFIKEYGDEMIMQYAGQYAEFLKVKSKEDVTSRVHVLKSNVQLRKDIIQYLRVHLRFMDCKFFVNDLKSLVKED